MQELIHVDENKANKVLAEIDKLISVAENATITAGECFIDLSFLLVEAKRGAYWTLRECKTEHEYIEKVFPQSRAQYYAFVRMGTHLQSFDRKKLKQWGRSKCEDLVRLQVHFEGDIPKEWMRDLEQDDKDTFRRRVRAYLDEKDEKKKLVEKHDPQTEDSFITLRIFGDGIHTFNLAMDTMAKIAGSDKSLGHRVELMAANFNAQFAEDGSGHVMGKNAYILSTIKGLVQQLDFQIVDTAGILIGIIAQGVEQNVGTTQVREVKEDEA